MRWNTVEDHDDSGIAIDRFWIETRDKSDDTIDDLSLGDPAIETAVEINNGNIVVPNDGGRGKR